MSKKKPEEQILQPQEAANNEALFEALGKSKKRRRRKTLLTVLVIVAVVVIAIAIAVNYFQKRVQERFDRMSGEVLSYTVQTGSISTVVSGSGTLANVDTETVSVPDGVELEEMLVEFGDLVKEGDLLAVADMASVKTALSDLQDTIEDLDEEIGDAESDEVSSFVRSGVSGRVKIIHAAKGDKVADVMMEQGALAVLSLDGYMAVQIQTDALAAGDSVTVTLSSGKTLTGTVEGVVGTAATVLVTDNGPRYDEEVTVSLEGAELGKGKLYIHNPLAVTGYDGLFGYRTDPETKENRYPKLELLRLAIPRRVYTDNHIRVVAAAVRNIYERREAITSGYRIAWEAPILRHFTVELEKI